jgi:hypothetical protein
VTATLRTILGIALLSCGVAMLLTGVVSIVAKTSSRRIPPLSLTLGGCALLVLGSVLYE